MLSLKSCKCSHISRYKLCKRRFIRLLLPLIAITLFIIPIACFHLQITFLPHGRVYRNAVYVYTPRWTWPMLELVVGWPNPNFPPPKQIEELLAAPSMQIWDTPQLNQGAAFIRLHIFSRITLSGRKRRDLIRQYSPLDLLAPAYRDIVELKFILGHHLLPGMETNTNMTQQEREIEMEIEEYGDIERLDGLLHGDNMNQGKSWEWARWVGKGREAQWVVKCDDDTFPILPNLLNRLLSLDPTKPTYFGTSMEHSPKFHFYFEGMMYGYSWHVVKTLSAVKKTGNEMYITKHEDARMGEVMYSLPTSPNCHRMYKNETCNPETRPSSGGWGARPLDPDPRTGLIRHDLGHLLGPKTRWWVSNDPSKAIGWHGLKQDQEYLDAYEASLEYFTWEGYPWYTAKALQYA